MSTQSSQWPNIEKMFFEDLTKLTKQCGPWDMIIFSGDLVQRGDRREFIQLDATLKRLYEHLNALGSDPVLVAVPGNHDLKRSPLVSAEVSRLQEYWDESSVRNEFWSVDRSPLRLFTRKVFSAYTRWNNAHPFRRPSTVQKGLLPGDFAATIDKGDITIGIVGLNSTFLQLQDGDYQGKLAIDTAQLIAVCGEHFTDWFDHHTVCFLMTHHPPSWLAPAAQDCLKRDIAVPGRFVAQLCGHLHEPLQETISIGGYPDARRCWQGASLFGLEFYGDDQKVERRHGYSAGILEVEPDKATIRIWPRQAQQHQAGFWRFMQDMSVTLEQDEGTKAELVVSRYQPRQVSGSERLKYEVLLLATDHDLGNARKSVAEHLKRSLGVTVTEGPGEHEKQYDLVVLLQAWWWSDGRCARVWKDRESSERIVFRIDSDADWPPKKLVEFEEEARIKTFCDSLAGCTQFKHPDQLPELVSKAVTTLMQAQSGGLDIGLKDWERGYLEFRLPAWRSGRTVQSRPHLFDAEQAEELYEPDLYVPMHGISLGWSTGSDGYPSRMKSKRRQKKKTLSGAEDEKRVPLARWLAVPDLPRLALVGAPGGGKTIFLTRLAAALAHSCLGRNLDFEPELDIERLRQKSRLPIPIVLEATRVSTQAPTSATALLKAIVEETSCAGVKGPDVTEIDAGLKSGRYLLLIDALDEIAESGARSQLLNILKGAAGIYPRSKLVLTTRSARYTGDLKFAPELETVEVAPLNRDQVRHLCRNWSTYRQHDEEYTRALISAASELAEKVGGGGDDQAITENPLMLTAICMVFERYRNLPDDRGRLCELLVDDLCRSRRSEDIERGWKLDESAKKDLLQRIAMAMQEQGLQSWPVESAIQIAQQIVPAADSWRHPRAQKYLDWAADHTGILRFQEVPGGGEQIRFWHRIFREYLAACRIAQVDTTASRKISSLWREGRLCNPFWEDVIRLLPRALGTFEKAKSVRETLEKLASKSKKDRGRLLALAAAGIIENRDLFPDVLFGEMASRMAKIYESEGLRWSLSDRLLFLESIGRLDHRNGDPRLHDEKWISINARGAGRGSEPVAPTVIGGWPVTVQEFMRFVDSQEFSDETLWADMPPSVIAAWSRLRGIAKSQMRHPNWPVVDVNPGAAIAYCRWRTRQRTDKKVVRLPTSADWHQISKTYSQKFPWGGETLGKDEDAQINWIGAGLRSPSPIGLFPKHRSGVFDLIGNVWEWGIAAQRSGKEATGRFVAFGISFQVDPANWVGLTLDRFWVRVPPNIAENGHESIGFRCVLADFDVKISSLDFMRPQN
jgi:hypothetical protein